MAKTFEQTRALTDKDLTRNVSEDLSVETSAGLPTDLESRQVYPGESISRIAKGLRIPGLKDREATRLLCELNKVKLPDCSKLSAGMTIKVPASEPFRLAVGGGREKPRIGLLAGNGLADPGAVRGGIFEKDLNQDVLSLVSAHLKNHNIVEVVDIHQNATAKDLEDNIFSNISERPQRIIEADVDLALQFEHDSLFLIGA